MKPFKESQDGQSLLDMPVLAGTVIQRSGVDRGKPISRDSERTWEGKLQGKVGLDMHGIALSAFDVTQWHTMLFCFYIPAH